jgi:hypothetical protein
MTTSRDLRQVVRGKLSLLKFARAAISEKCMHVGAGITQVHTGVGALQALVTNIIRQT